VSVFESLTLDKLTRYPGGKRHF